MGITIRIRRGMKADLPELAVGEFGYCLDTKELYIGGQTGNEKVNVHNLDEIADGTERKLTDFLTKLEATATYADKEHSHSWESILLKPEEFPPSSHDHDERYDTRVQSDVKLALKAEKSELESLEASVSAHTAEATTRLNNLEHDLGLAETELTRLEKDKSDKTHNHDDVYYKKAETYKQSEIDIKDSAVLIEANQYAEAKITELIDGAPEAYDTLLEIAQYIEEHGETSTALITEVAELKATKADKSVVDPLVTREIEITDDIASLQANKAEKNHNHDEVYAKKAHDHDDKYYTESEVDLKLDAKADSTHNHDATYAKKSHSHEIAEVDGLQAALDNKAASNHNHDSAYADINHNHDTVYADIDHNHDTSYADISHNHSISEVTGLQAALDNKAASNHNHDTSYADINHNHDTSYADINHNHDTSYADIDHNHDTSYADIDHNHLISEVTGLQAELDSKASATHSHSYNDLDDKPTIPVVPDIELNDSTETSGKYISKIEVDGTNKHKLNITKKELPQGFSGNYNDLTNKPAIYTKTEIDAMIGDIETLLGGI